MRNGTVIIGGVNVFNAYGVYVNKRGYKELLQWPSLKSVSGNDWQEYDGFEPDLSNPRLDTRTFSVTFGCMGDKGNVRSFYDYLLTNPKMSYSFQDIGWSADLRVVSMPNLKYCEAFNIITVKFACDDPPSGGSSSASSSSSGDRTYVIDGVPLSSYGIRTLKGTLNSTLRQPDVKPLLLRNNSVIDGAEYDQNPVINDTSNSLGSGYSSVSSTAVGVTGNWKQSVAHGTVTTRARDITLSCLYTGSSLSGYFSLLSDLAKKNGSASDSTLAGARIISIRPLGHFYYCYYKSQQVTDFYMGANEMWVKFDLTLTLFEELGSSGGDDSGGGGGGGGSISSFFFTGQRGRRFRNHGRWKTDTDYPVTDY